MKTFLSTIAAWFREEARLATAESWAHEDMTASSTEWPITQAIRRAILRWTIRRDTERLDRLHKLMVEERAMVEAVYRREIESVEDAISDASASLARLSSEALTRRAMARVR